MHDCIYYTALEIADKPRRVIPKSLEEIPESVKEFLQGYGFTAEKISNLIWDE